MSEKDAEKFNFYHSYIYDSPDGQDCVRKTFHLTKITGFAGTIIGLFDTIAMPRAPEALAFSAGRVLSHALPAAAVGAIFASTTCISAHISGQDSAWNHVIGGCAAGTIYGARMNKGIIACAGCVLGGTLAGVTKVAKRHPYTIPQPYPTNNMTFNSYRRKWFESWGPPECKPPKNY